VSALKLYKFSLTVSALKLYKFSLTVSVLTAPIVIYFGVINFLMFLTAAKT